MDEFIGSAIPSYSFHQIFRLIDGMELYHVFRPQSSVIEINCQPGVNGFMVPVTLDSANQHHCGCIFRHLPH
jgi:hypothetical protein